MHIIMAASIWKCVNLGISSTNKGKELNFFKNSLRFSKITFLMMQIALFRNWTDLNSLPLQFHHLRDPLTDRNCQRAFFRAMTRLPRNYPKVWWCWWLAFRPRLWYGSVLRRWPHEKRRDQRSRPDRTAAEILPPDVGKRSGGG